jgi:hypothetical protein
MRTTFEKAIIVVALASAACHTMVPLTFDEVGATRPGTVYLTRGDATMLELTGPQVFGDTIVGYDMGGNFYELDRKEISRVTVRQSAKGKTMALVAAGIAGAAAIGVLISGIGEDSPPYDCNDTPEIPPCQGQGP